MKVYPLKNQVIKIIFYSVPCEETPALMTTVMAAALKPGVFFVFAVIQELDYW